MNSTKKIPTILLTGFLGAGKTTLLNRLIEHYQSTRTVLLINEFGKIGIDGELLRAGNYEKIELNKGSLFCICVRTDFIFEVEKIAKEIQPELLIIEATGLADTSEMEKMLALPNLIDKIHLRACLCLVDAVNFYKIKGFLRAPITQIQSADLVLVNKTDLAGAAKVAEAVQSVREISPGVPILETRFAEFPLEMLKQVSHPEPTTTEAPGEGRPDLVVSVTLEATGSIPAVAWKKFADRFQPAMLRAKGFITIDGAAFHCDGTLDGTWNLTPTDKILPGQNRLVLIGQRLNEDEIRQIFSEWIHKN